MDNDKKLIEKWVALILKSQQKQIVADVANELIFKIAKKSDVIAGRGSSTYRFVFELLDHSNENVRTYAASMLIYTDPQKARDVILEVKDGGYFPVSADAWMLMDSLNKKHITWATFSKDVKNNHERKM